MVEEDYKLDPNALCEVLGVEAVKAGVKIHQNTPVFSVFVGESKEVYGIDSALGFIDCQNFVDASGMVNIILNIL